MALTVQGEHTYCSIISKIRGFTESINPHESQSVLLSISNQIESFLNEQRLLFERYVNNQLIKGSLEQLRDKIGNANFLKAEEKKIIEQIDEIRKSLIHLPLECFKKILKYTNPAEDLLVFTHVSSEIKALSHEVYIQFINRGCGIKFVISSKEEFFELIIKHGNQLTHLNFFFAEYIECQDLEEILSYCPNLQKIFLTERICIHGSNVLKFLSSLPKLEYLEISDDNIRDLPKSIGSLKSLKTLTLDGCDNLEVIPDEVGELSSLEYLIILECRLQEISPKIVNLPNLKTVKIIECPNLTSVSQLPAEFHTIKHKIKFLKRPGYGCIFRIDDYI